MSSNAVSEDLRSIKTERALFAAMFSLLKRCSFLKITVKSICEEASISRAAFYAHYIDKFDLLKSWLDDLWKKSFSLNQSFERAEELFNPHAPELSRILKNLIIDMDDAAFEVIFDFLLSTKNMNTNKSYYSDIYQRNIVMCNFYAGGIISYLMWQAKNMFPAEVPLVNKSFYDMLNKFQAWE